MFLKKNYDAINKNWGLVFFILLLFYACSNSESEMDQPNIIFLMTDDQRWDNMGCYGKPEFNTPNIDQLANQGVVFD